MRNETPRGESALPRLASAVLGLMGRTWRIERPGSRVLLEIGELDGRADRKVPRTLGLARLVARRERRELHRDAVAALRPLPLGMPADDADGGGSPYRLPQGSTIAPHGLLLIRLPKAQIAATGK